MAKHIHRYKLKNLSRDKTKAAYWVYTCIKQECTHHIRVDLVDGKVSECNRCGDPFEMRVIDLVKGRLDSENVVIIVKPHCKPCTKGKKSEEKKKLTSDIDDLMSSFLPRNI